MVCLARNRPASCICIFNSSMGVVMRAWNSPANPPASIWRGNDRGLCLPDEIELQRNEGMELTVNGQVEIFI